MSQNTVIVRQANEMLLHVNLGNFCRWLGEVWSSRGLDVVCEMLEKPWNWMDEWNEFNWLCQRFDVAIPQCTKDDMDENPEDFSG